MISVVVLTHNNAGSIEQTLQSLAWSDEIIIIDDYSTDKTISIASTYKAKIIQHRLNHDFAAQRNFGLSKVKGEWVLFVDSDEVVSEELKKEIQRAIKETRYPGYFMKRQDYFMGHPLKHGETGKVRLLRLAKKDAGIWKRPVHEVWDIKGETGELDFPLDHYPHPDVAQFVADIDRYSSLNADYLFHRGVHVSWWQIVLYPVAKFFVDYVWYLGFLDGTAGAIVAIMMSFHSFLSRAKLFMKWQTREG